MNWASDWTALGEYSIITGAGGGNPSTTITVTPPTPGQPTIAVTRGGGNIQINFPSQNNVQYQLQSSTTVSGLPAGWVNEGSPQAGTGGALNFTPAASGNAKFFRVVVP